MRKKKDIGKGGKEGMLIHKWVQVCGAPVIREGGGEI